MPTISERHPVGIEPRSHTDDLVTHADAKDRFGPLSQRLSQLQRGVPALLRVAWSIRQKQSIKLIPDAVEIIVPRHDCDSSATADERAQNVGLRAEVENSDLDVAGGVKYVRLFGGHLVDEVLLARIPVLVLSRRRLRCIGTDSKTSKSGTLITEKCGDGTSIHARDAWDVVTIAPRCDGFNGKIMGIFFCHVRDDNAGTLDPLGFKNDTDILCVHGSLIIWYAVIANERGGENKDLAAV